MRELAICDPLTPDGHNGIADEFTNKAPSVVPKTVLFLTMSPPGQQHQSAVLQEGGGMTGNPEFLVPFIGPRFRAGVELLYRTRRVTWIMDRSAACLTVCHQELPVTQTGGSMCCPRNLQCAGHMPLTGCRIVTLGVPHLDDEAVIASDNQH